MLGSEPTSNGYVIEITTRLHHYSRTSSDLKILLPSSEKTKICQKFKNQNFQKSSRWGAQTYPHWI